MREYDPNPGLSAFVVVLGGLLGLALGVVLGLGTAAVLALLILGVLLAGFAASALGIVGARTRDGRSDDDLPPEYYDY